MRIRPVELKDRKVWADLRATLWPDAPADELAHETLQHFVHKPLADLVLVAEGTSGRLLGFLELSLRAYAEGCASSPVPFIEGWYVTTDARHQGVGRRLVDAAEDWSRIRGFTELASDTTLDNRLGQDAHAALGFEEAERIVSFRKTL